MPDRIHHRGEPGDGSGPEIVAVGEPAGEDHRVGVLEVSLGMPDRNGFPAHEPHRPRRVAIVVRSRERDDGDPRAGAHPRGSPSSFAATRNTSITGFDSTLRAISSTV